jgi:uncharacterized protein (DUF1697 family)
MSSIVFFRSVNVGAHQRFQPGLLAKDLAEFEVVNIGAAGTFVARKQVAEGKLRAEILARLPFKPELMVCSARELLELAKSEPFRDATGDEIIGKFLTVMNKVPAAPPPLPLDWPANDEWEVRIFKVVGRFALSVRRPRGKGNVYPNAIIEKQLGVSATTRNWNTIESLRTVLGK